VEFHPVAPPALLIDDPKFGRIFIGQPPEIEHMRAAGDSADFIQLVPSP
jgi:hypothetical protein